MFRRAGRDLGLIHQVEAGWSLLELWRSRHREKMEKFFPLIFFRYFGKGTDLCSLFVSFAGIETVKSSLKAKRKMGQGIFDVS